FNQHDRKLVSHRKCTASSPDIDIHDSVVLHFKLRAPETAQGFSFDFRFFSREYPYYLCTSFNDFFMTIVTDENGKPFIDTDNDGDISDEDGNISFDKLGNAVSVNNAFFTSCVAPACKDKDAMYSIKTDGCPGIFDCKSNQCGTCEDGIKDVYAYIQNPYSGKGAANQSDNRGGGTTWLTTTAPIPGGKVFNIDFYIWDTHDNIFDSSVILDNFRWRCGKTYTGTNFSNPDPYSPIN
ncbi:MAG: choice-of-anchor L domain-containing protein, partial [Proteobacteria bacterium]|nr:choice-of-anchor L domain-containing protein [Pseudomonadota bacterium]